MTSPAEEFAAVIETYQALPPGWIPSLAAGLPWVELLTGLFLLAGHRTRAAAAAAAAMLAAFIGALLWASARGLALDRCGCFGSLVRLTPGQAVAADALLLASSYAALRWGAQLYSLDRWEQSR